MTVETGIPIPTRKTAKYDFEEIGVDQSKFYAVTGKEFYALRVGLQYHKTTHPGQQYMTRKMDGGLRVWRIT